MKNESIRIYLAGVFDNHGVFSRRYRRVFFNAKDDLFWRNCLRLLARFNARTYKSRTKDGYFIIQFMARDTPLFLRAIYEHSKRKKEIIEFLQETKGWV